MVRPQAPPVVASFPASLPASARPASPGGGGPPPSAGGGAPSLDVASSTAPTTTPAMPRPNPSVEIVASELSASTSDCELWGQVLVGPHADSSVDFLPSAMMPKAEPTMIPAPPAVRT